MKFAIRCCALLLGAALTATAGAADAKLEWPGKQITWVIGFVPGGTADVLTRIAAQELARRSGLNVIV
ncbi:ABC transporter substrate-binding protein, partial [Achromobacter xylosoxidans]